MVIQQQAIEYTEGYNPSIMNQAYDGILGLAFIQANTVIPTRVGNPMENIITQNRGKGVDETEGLEFKGFTCKFNSLKPGVYEDGSFLTFGYIDQNTLDDVHIKQCIPCVGE